MNSSFTANLEAFNQACEMIRHLQNLRFTVFTAFLVLSGALFSVALRYLHEKKGLPLTFKICAAAGITVAIIFGCAEWRISERIDFYTQKVADLGKLTNMNERAYEAPPNNKCWMLFTRIQMIVVYVGTIVIWCIAIARFCGRCSSSANSAGTMNHNKTPSDCRPAS